MQEVRVYSLASEGNVQITPHFNVREFRCKDGGDAVFVSLRLAELLEQIRVHFGAAVTINSAYRTPSHNAKVGGTSRSQHLYGLAADIEVKGHSPAEVADYAETLLAGTGGIGRYDGFTHVDVRQEKGRWRG